VPVNSSGPESFGHHAPRLGIVDIVGQRGPQSPVTTPRTDARAARGPVALVFNMDDAGGAFAAPFSLPQAAGHARYQGLHHLGTDTSKVSDICGLWPILFNHGALPPYGRRAGIDKTLFRLAQRSRSAASGPFTCGRTA